MRQGEGRDRFPHRVTSQMDETRIMDWTIDACMKSVGALNYNTTERSHSITCVVNIHCYNIALQIASNVRNKHSQNLVCIVNAV